QVHLQRAAAAFLGSLTSGVANQDLPHGASGNGEEVGPALPVWIGLVGQAQISLVNEHRGLQCVVGTLPLHKMMSEASQFFIDERGQLCESGILPVTPLLQELGHSVRRDRRLIHKLVLVAYHPQKPSARRSFSGKTSI